MSRNIQIGFSMHPRWVEGGDLRAFLAPLQKAGLSLLEFELDDRMDCWEDSLPLMQKTAELGLELSFHAPYRSTRSLVGFSGEHRDALQAEYEPLLRIAEEWGTRLGSMRTLVVHAAVAHPPVTPEALKTDTFAYLRWIQETFPNVRIALENNHPPIAGEIKVGIQRKDILNFAAGFPKARMGICWDMGHDYLRHQPDGPSAEWYKRVIHVHVHDVDRADQDHYPLVLGNVPYHTWLQGLKKTGMKGAVVLELKGDRLRGWSMDQITSALVGSLEKMAGVLL